MIVTFFNPVVRFRHAAPKDSSTRYYTDSRRLGQLLAEKRTMAL